jgi:hypothetical protein
VTVTIPADPQPRADFTVTPDDASKGDPLAYRTVKLEAWEDVKRRIEKEIVG